MTKLITILTKKVWEPWVAVETDGSPNEYFTQEELDTVMTPYAAYVKSQPGLDISLTEKYRTDTDMVTVRYFDTLEHAQQAAINITGIGPNPNPIVATKNNLVRQKMEAASVTYQVSTKII